MRIVEWCDSVRNKQSEKTGAVGVCRKEGGLRRCTVLTQLLCDGLVVSLTPATSLQSNPPDLSRPSLSQAPSPRGLVETVSRVCRDLPVLAVENASHDDERRVAATIAELAAHPEWLGLKSPAVLIFGEVAGLPAHGVVEDILASEEVKRIYA